MLVQVFSSSCSSLAPMPSTLRQSTAANVSGKAIDDSQALVVYRVGKRVTIFANGVCV